MLSWVGGVGVGVTKRDGAESGGGGEEHQMEAGREVEDSLCHAGWSLSLYAESGGSTAERSLTGIDGPKC